MILNIGCWLSVCLTAIPMYRMVHLQFFPWWFQRLTPTDWILHGQILITCFQTHLWQLLAESNTVVTCRYSVEVEMVRTSTVQPTLGYVQSYASFCCANNIQLGMLETWSRVTPIGNRKIDFENNVVWVVAGKDMVWSIPRLRKFSLFPVFLLREFHQDPITHSVLSWRSFLVVVLVVILLCLPNAPGSRVPCSRQ